MTQKAFHTAVSTLRQQLGVKETNTNASSEEGDFYTIQVGPIEIELVGSQEGFINLLCFPGDLLNLSAESLAVLLAANRYQEAHPIITVSVLEGTPAKIVLWSRIPLADANPTAFGDLFVRFAEMGYVTQKWIAAGTPGLDGKKKKDETSSKGTMSTAARLRSMAAGKIPGK